MATDDERGRYWPVGLVLPYQQTPIRGGLWCQEHRPAGWACRVTVSLWAGDPPSPVRTPLLVPASAVTRVPGVAYDGVPTWRHGEGWLAETRGRELWVHHRFCPAAGAGTVTADPEAADLLATGRATACPECGADPQPATPRPVPGHEEVPPTP